MAELGKKWQDKVKSAWKASFPGTFIYRLPDQVSGNKHTSANPCDFFGFTDGHLFLIECKQHKGASVPFTAVPQYERLLAYKGIPNVHPGVIIWFSEKDLVIWCSIQSLEAMVNDGRKSVSVKFFKDGLYNIKEIPGQKKRFFIQPDLTYLLKIAEEETPCERI